MFVAVVLVCVQAIVQDMRDCTVGTAIQIIRLEQLFFTEEECLNRGALGGVDSRDSLLGANQIQDCF